ncbi:ABC transporter permease [Nonomuraea sediminis]|uniref:ABC transporter permease n=1 Tax=Nonomuraea sediminis TaxID=2835864 RepID=UPI001BDD240D|nr:ABC transporter permease [Nonomuraea sediminis]
MSTLTLAVRDSTTMLRRQLTHLRRYPALTMMTVGTPVIFLLLFVYVFGGTLGDGLGGALGGRADYINYITPGILIMAVAGAAQSTATSVATDMTEGIVARFRTMAIARVSVLTGHVVGSVLQTAMSMAVVVGVALLIGFRSPAGVTGWLAAGGLLLLVSLAFTWLSVALGLMAGNVEIASNLPLPLMLLPMLGSGFVPTGSMPAGLRWFADYQPFTPIIETVRALITGTPTGADLWMALAWSAVIGIGGYLWAKKLYNRI